MGTFADIRTSIPRTVPKGCPRCGASENEGQVSLRLYELRGSKVGPHVSSKSRSMCEGCAVEVYQALLETFEEELEWEE